MTIESQPTTIYIASPVELLIDDNQTATVYGFEKCPNSDANWLWFAVPSLTVVGENCIKFDASSTEVKVGLSTSGRICKETWRISYHEGAVKLIRPNGFEIQQAKLG